MTNEQKIKIKSENERIISEKGYRINDWLPILEHATLKSVNEIKGRMSVMNALLNIAFEAPTHIIKKWIQTHNLTNFLSNYEKEILEKSNADLTVKEINSLHWYLEGLWAFMWLTKMIDDIAAEKHVGNNLASLLPNLERGDNNEKLDKIQGIRHAVEIYKMLDYYYRLHWYCRDERLNGKQAKLNEGLIYHRRKSLEWVSNSISEWDYIELGT